MNSREIIKRLEKEGWEKVGQKGSHVQSFYNFPAVHNSFQQLHT
jgi:predicted RNA binding protein YcfA (HicA-like mRNA interferase family)